MQADTLIIGGGISGIVTALELLGGGQKVCLVERGSPEDFGGLAPWSFGGLFFADSPTQKRVGIKDSVDLAWKDWQATAQFADTDVLPSAWAKNYVEQSTPILFHWLKDLGVKIFPFVNWVERGLYTPGNSVPRFHLVWGTGFELTRVLVDALNNHPNANTHLSIHYHTRVDEFRTQNNRVIGARAVDEQTGTPIEFTAENTVVATGGMGGNLEKVRAHWNPTWGTPPEVILNGASPYIDGSGIDACAKIHANITHLDKSWPYAGGIHHPNPRHANHGLSIVPPRSALWMNYKGERMGPIPLPASSFDTQFAVTQICQEEKKYSWQILNRKIMLKEFAISGSEHNPDIRDKKLLPFLRTLLKGNHALMDDMLNNCSDFVVANSLDELAVKMNALTGTNDVNAERMKNDIRTYDNMIRRGKKYHNDDQLRRIAQLRQYLGDKLRTCNFQTIEDESAQPYIAIREFICSRKTLGGVQTNLRSQVTQKGTTGLNPAVIDGLYAVGEVAGYGGGGMNGDAVLEGTFLGGCMFSARVAAYAILNKKLF